MRKLAGVLDDAPQGAAIAPAALRMAEQLEADLARRNVPTWPALNHDPAEAALSVWYGLVVRTDGTRIWWRRPWTSHRGRPLFTYAHSAAAAAARLAEDYQQVRSTTPSLWQARPHPDAAPTRGEGLPG